MTPRPAPLLAALLLVTAVQLTAAPTASADDPVTPPIGAQATVTPPPGADPMGPPPGTESNVAPPEVDGNSPGLKMRDGATLATAKVLPLISIVESEGGEERREETSTNLKFALQAEVLFGKNSANLNREANARISAIAQEIRTQGATKVRVFGFTDNLGSSTSGDVLSKKRADAVHGVLAPQLASEQVSYEIRGYGEQYPIADNSTEEGRKKNRRVEVSFPRD
ncbi:OmpA family protein [Streptomyces sp. NPDC046887]|uniref:OmpA family protein n=1 Tax=Streptomyces sp. NPDC046887 TaxID=3155472 RepID=UPI0033D0635D